VLAAALLTGVTAALQLVGIPILRVPRGKATLLVQKAVLLVVRVVALAVFLHPAFKMVAPPAAAVLAVTPAVLLPPVPVPQAGFRSLTPKG
jgi:hypothetical protein